MLEISTKAPDFSLPDADGKTHSLSQYAGNWVLIYFYPKDDTPGCTIEACSFRDNFPKFDDKKIKVLGISADTVSSHKKFSEKHSLNFTLLADQKKDVIGAYDAGGIFTRRISYLVDPSGNIFTAYAKVEPASHAEQVLADLPK